ncbi:MAG: EamA family transporter [Tissierellia bacterium]|nr:EamA family transporter [Tissierellia bacterium]
MTTRQRGIISVIISATIFGILPLMSKIIYSQGCNSISLVFYRFLFVLPVLYILIYRNPNETLKIDRGDLKKIIWVSLLGHTATSLLLFTSYNYIPSGMATTIHFTYPVFVILGCMIFFREKPSTIKMASVLLCFLGIILFYDGNGGIDPIGIILAFASGITYAFYTVYIDKSGLSKMYTYKLIFYLCLVSAIIVLVFGIVTRSFIINIKPVGWMVIIALSLLAGLGGVGLYQVGIKTIGPQDTAILSTFEPITSIIVSILVLKEPFGIKIAIGVGLILAAVILISIFEDEEQLSEGVDDP